MGLGMWAWSRRPAEVKAEYQNEEYLSALERGMSVGLSVSETADLLRFPHTTTQNGQTDLSVK